VDLLATVTGLVQASWCEKHHEQTHNQLLGADGKHYPNSWHNIEELLKHVGLVNSAPNTMNSRSDFFADGKAGTYIVSSSDPKVFEGEVIDDVGEDHVQVSSR